MSILCTCPCYQGRKKKVFSGGIKPARLAVSGYPGMFIVEGPNLFSTFNMAQTCCHSLGCQCHTVAPMGGRQFRTLLAPLLCRRGLMAYKNVAATFTVLTLRTTSNCHLRPVGMHIQTDQKERTIREHEPRLTTHPTNCVRSCSSIGGFLCLQAI